MSPHRNRFRPSARQSAVALAAVSTVLNLAACGGKDPYAPTAQYQTVASAPLTLYPLSRVRAPLNPALDVRIPQPLRPGVQVSALGLAPTFDVAFDVDTAGRILLLHPKQIVSTTIVPKIGFQTSGTRYDSLGAAPGGTYEQDSTVRVSVGQTVVVQSQGISQGRVDCYSGATFFYAKLVVDSYDPASGALSVRVTVDPNCNFRSFASGVPTS